MSIIYPIVLDAHVFCTSVFKRKGLNAGVIVVDADTNIACVDDLGPHASEGRFIIIVRTLMNGDTAFDVSFDGRTEKVVIQRGPDCAPCVSGSIIVVLATMLDMQLHPSVAITMMSRNTFVESARAALSPRVMWVDTDTAKPRQKHRKCTDDRAIILERLPNAEISVLFLHHLARTGTIMREWCMSRFLLYEDTKKFVDGAFAPCNQIVRDAVIKWLTCAESSADVPVEGMPSRGIDLPRGLKEMQDSAKYFTSPEVIEIIAFYFSTWKLSDAYFCCKYGLCTRKFSLYLSQCRASPRVHRALAHWKSSNK